MRRHVLGVTAALLLVAFVVIFFRAQDSNDRLMASVCMRAGLVLGAIWLAFPQVVDLGKRYPPWLIILTVCTFGIIVINPKLILLIAPLFIALGIVQFISWMFKPPKKRRRRTSGDKPATKHAESNNDS